jgi:hypothetical protein
MEQPMSIPLSLFYVHAYEDASLCNELEKHLRLLQRRGVIITWHDRLILPGTDWAHVIDTYLMTAQIILLLISPDFLDSDYCYGIEMQRALERQRLGEASVIPVILRPVDWHGAPFARLQCLPRNARPVTLWNNRDEAFQEVAKGIREVVEGIQATPPISRALSRQTVPMSRNVPIPWHGMKGKTSIVVIILVVLAGLGILLSFKTFAHTQGSISSNGLTQTVLSNSPTQRVPSPVNTPTPQQTVQVPTIATVDTSSNPLSATNIGNGSWTHTIGAHQNRLLLVGVITAAPSIGVSSVTFHEMPLKRLQFQTCPKDCRDELWYLINPPTGAGSISVITASKSNYFIAGAVSFYNIDQTVPFGEIKTIQGDGTSSTLSVSSSASQLVVDFYGNQATPPGFTPTPPSDQTQQLNRGDYRSQEIASSTKAGASLYTTMTWNWEKTNYYADIVVPINSH